jgi:hypothetical protein
LLLFGVGVAFAGDGWGRESRVDAGIGWWLTVCGVAMIAVQLAIFIRG